MVLVSWSEQAQCLDMDCVFECLCIHVHVHVAEHMCAKDV